MEWLDHSSRILFLRPKIAETNTIFSSNLLLIDSNALKNFHCLVISITAKLENLFIIFIIVTATSITG